MKKNNLLAVLSIASLSIFISASFPNKIKPYYKKYADNEILIKFKDNTNSQTKSNFINSHGLKSIKEFKSNGFSRVQLDGSRSVEKAVEDMKKNPEIEFTQPNYIYRKNTAPNDTYYNQEWGLNNTTSPNNDMNMEKAWDKITDCSSVIVAVIDTGINYNHQDLSGNMWTNGSGYHGYDFVDNDNYPMDLDGHGTHVAGTIGAVGNNSTGITGVCWKAQIMAVRCLDETGSGTTADIISGLNYAVTNGAKIVNLSLGGSSGTQGDLFSQAIDSARSAGVLIVCAAGNDGEDNDKTASYPANYTQDNILSIAALDSDYKLSQFSNYGATSVDAGAPGESIISTLAGTAASIGEDFTNGTGLDWTQVGDIQWGLTSISDDLISGYTSNYLVLPGTWPNGTYSNNIDSLVYKTFGITGNEDSISFNFVTKFDIQTGDSFYVYILNAAGNPNSAGNLSDKINTSFDNTDNEYYGFSFQLANYLSGSSYCTIGYRFTSDGTTASGNHGVGIAGKLSGYSYYFFTIDTMTLNNTTYKTESGTSMAAPHASGLAAMILAFNPKYTYADAINSIKNGGDSISALSGKTVSGKAINAWGSLTYIAPTTGLKITPQ